MNEWMDLIKSYLIGRKNTGMNNTNGWIIKWMNKWLNEWMVEPE